MIEGGYPDLIEMSTSLRQPEDRSARLAILHFDKVREERQAFIGGDI